MCIQVREQLLVQVPVQIHVQIQVHNYKDMYKYLVTSTNQVQVQRKGQLSTLRVLGPLKYQKMRDIGP